MNDFLKSGTIKVEVSDIGLLKICGAVIATSAVILIMWVVAKRQ